MENPQSPSGIAFVSLFLKDYALAGYGKLGRNAPSALWEYFLGSPSPLFFPSYSFLVDNRAFSPVVFKMLTEDVELASLHGTCWVRTDARLCSESVFLQSEN